MRCDVERNGTFAKSELRYSRDSVASSEISRRSVRCWNVPVNELGRKRDANE